MTYPPAGIPVSLGSAWGVSLTPSTVGSAFIGLANPGAVTFPRMNADNSITARTVAGVKSDLALDNVTNESKPTMFTNPQFTGGIGVTLTGSLTKKIEANTIHTTNIDDEIRIGSYTGGNFYGLSMNYRIDGVGNPLMYLCHSYGTTRSSTIQLVGNNIIVAGTVTATNHLLSSDRRLKSKIKNISTAPLKVSYKQFELKSDPGQIRYGVIAQELQKNHPEFVRKDDKGMLSVAYTDLFAFEFHNLKHRVSEIERRLLRCHY